jgi:hypothetical protein
MPRRQTEDPAATSSSTRVRLSVAMAEDPSAAARHAALREAAQRAAELRAHSAELIAVSRELRARVAQLKHRAGAPPATGPPRSDGPVPGDD